MNTGTIKEKNGAESITTVEINTTVVTHSGITTSYSVDIDVPAFWVEIIILLVVFIVFRPKKQTPHSDDKNFTRRSI